MKYWYDEARTHLATHTLILVEDGNIVTHKMRGGEGACAYEDYVTIKWGPKDLIRELWTPSAEPAANYMGEMCMDEEH
jgi:hypothetical protein